MFNKILIGCINNNSDNDIIKQLKKADYFVEVSSFKYSYTSGMPDTFYKLYDLNITKHSNVFKYPWKVELSIYSLRTFDICFSPLMKIYSNNLNVGSLYFGVCYINNILIYTEENSASTYKVNITDGVDNINGETYKSTSYKQTATILSEYFDNDIYSTYSENTDINIPLFIAFYKDVVPNEIIEISNNKDPVTMPS